MFSPDYLASGAALLAAAFSAVSLVLTRRWQQRDRAQEATSQTKAWVLGNLKDALVDHINLSFKISRACNDGRHARKRGNAVGVNEALGRVTDLHLQYMDLLLYLRLFGTPTVVKSAERLHVSLDQLVDLTFGDAIADRGLRSFASEEIPPGLTEVHARSICMDNREVLINDAREYLGLPRDAVIDRHT